VNAANSNHSPSVNRKCTVPRVVFNSSFHVVSRRFWHTTGKGLLKFTNEIRQTWPEQTLSETTEIPLRTWCYHVNQWPHYTVRLTLLMKYGENPWIHFTSSVDDPLKLNCSVAAHACFVERQPYFVSIQAADSIRSVHRTQHKTAS